MPQSYDGPYPSVSRIASYLNISRDLAKQIRAIMEGKRWVDNQSRLSRIDALLPNTHGVEYISPGSNDKSPAIWYCNTGDTYGATVMRVKGRFRLGAWGDIVEKGNYE